MAFEDGEASGGSEKLKNWYLKFGDLEDEVRR